jgi:MFS family permease
MCPLLPEIATSLHLTKSNVWLTNIYSMVGGIPMGLVLGPLCDQYVYGASILIMLMCLLLEDRHTGLISHVESPVCSR